MTSADRFCSCKRERKWQTALPSSSALLWYKSNHEQCNWKQKLTSIMKCDRACSRVLVVDSLKTSQSFCLAIFFYFIFSMRTEREKTHFVFSVSVSLFPFSLSSLSVSRFLKCGEYIVYAASLHRRRRTTTNTRRSVLVVSVGLFFAHVLFFINFFLTSWSEHICQKEIECSMDVGVKKNKNFFFDLLE